MQDKNLYGTLKFESIGRNLKGVSDGLLHRFLQRLVENENGCWLWTGAQNEHGYGNFYPREGEAFKWNLSTHRLAYELAIGVIPLGQHVHHKCQHKLCCNPEHLQSLTPEEHGKEEGRLKYRLTHCHRGHEFTPDNTYTSKRGKRRCRTCVEERRRQNYLQAFGTAQPSPTCEKGHLFDDANTFWYTSSGGYKARGCRRCRTESRRAATIRSLQKYLPIRDSIKPSATHCINGHEYAIEGWSVSQTGQIRCKQCSRNQANTRSARIRESRPIKIRTHCRKGHEMSPENVSLSQTGKVRCKTCARDWQNVKNAREREGREPKPERTHCIHGHEFTESNTYVYRGVKFCRACHAKKTLSDYHDKKARLRVATDHGEVAGDLAPGSANGTHCKRGHLLPAVGNQRGNPNRRICLLCSALRTRLNYFKKKGNVEKIALIEAELNK